MSAIEFDDDAELEDYPGLLAVAQFARMMDQVAWFSDLGEPLDERQQDLALDYLAALGFPDCDVAPIEDWETATEAAMTTDLNSDWWEAEEQQRMFLLSEACQRADEEAVMLALTHVTSRAAEGAQQAAALAANQAGIYDEEVINAVAGAVLQAVHQAALVLAAEAEDDHPFALKYRLFEQGRWPLGISGRSFNLF